MRIIAVAIVLLLGLCLSTCYQTTEIPRGSTYNKVPHHHVYVIQHIDMPKTNGKKLINTMKNMLIYVELLRSIIGPITICPSCAT